PTKRRGRRRERRQRHEQRHAIRLPVMNHTEIEGEEVGGRGAEEEENGKQGKKTKGKHNRDGCPQEAAWLMAAGSLLLDACAWATCKLQAASCTQIGIAPSSRPLDIPGHQASSSLTIPSINQFHRTHKN